MVLSKGCKHVKLQVLSLGGLGEYLSGIAIVSANGELSCWTLSKQPGLRYFPMDTLIVRSKIGLCFRAIRKEVPHVGRQNVDRYGLLSRRVMDLSFDSGPNLSFRKVWLHASK